MEDHSRRKAGLGTSATRIVTDLNGRIVEATRGAGNLLAIDERSLPGRPFDAFVARERVREFETLLFELAQGNGPVRASLRLHRPDGESLEVDVEAVAEGSGKRLEWVLAAALREEAPQLAVPDLKAVPLQRLLARLPVGVISLDSYLTVDYVNPAGRVFVEGVEVGAMLPDPLPLVSVREFAGRLFASTLPSRQVVETRDGRLLELDGIAGDKAESAILLVQDVTSRERHSRAELEFAANAAHELRTPIAAITSALDVLKSGAEDVRADRDLFLGHIERETARLARLVEALMLLARIQMDQEQPSLRLVEAAPLLEEIAAGLEPAEGVTVHVVCPPSVAMLTDADLLRQAVWNLATNAVRYTVAGEIRLTGRDLGRMAEIEVRDTGPGIAPADRPRIFSRFYRSQRRTDGGFGLGLPLSQEIARALGGNLTLDSEPGVGTRVRVHVPSARLVG